MTLPGKYGRRSFSCCPLGGQRGASLIVTMLMLIAVFMIGVSAAQIALQEEKASRNEGDRQIAMQAAEAALADAETDIENSRRSYLFMRNPVMDVAADSDGNNGPSDLYLGLWLQSGYANPPVWQVVDFTNKKANMRSVPYGYFTGRSLQAGAGALPARLPRYILELLTEDTGAGGGAGATPVFRITAIGYGMKESTQVVLQTLYRRAGKDGHEAPEGRISWREILNWKELHDAIAKQ